MASGSFPGSLLYDRDSAWIYAWDDMGWRFHVCVIIFNGQISHYNVPIFLSIIKMYILSHFTNINTAGSAEKDS